MKYTITKKYNWGLILPIPQGVLASTLEKYMSYELPGKQFMPNPAWAVKKLYRRKTGAWPFGLLNVVKSVLDKYCSETGDTYEIEWQPTTDKPTVPVMDRKYQQEALQAIIDNNGGVLCLPTGSGKTVIIAKYIELMPDYKALVIVPTLDIKRQWESYKLQNMTVSTYQNPKIKDEVKEYDIVVMDECIHGRSYIRMGDGTQIRIDKLETKWMNKEVLSYNEEKKVFEPKKVIRFIKNQGTMRKDSWAYKTRWFNLKIMDETGEIHNLKVTGDHKIWTQQGYKKVIDLKKSDILKTYLEPVKYFCNICGKETDKSGKGGCMMNHIYPGLLKEKSSSNIKKMQQNGTLSRNGHNTVTKREINGIWRQALKKMGERRRGRDNPIFRHPDTIHKMSVGRKAAFDRMTHEEQIIQIKRFMNAPKYTRDKPPTKPEQYIINMNIQGLKYTGKGDFWVEFKDGTKKNPDFKLIDEQKVIEVGDFEYWHEDSEKIDIINKYAEVGYKCIYLDAKDVVNNECDGIIKKFCYNHSAKVISCVPSRRRFNNKNKITYLYDLEVEDNHNYLANNILVSNCHHTSARTIYSIAMQTGTSTVVIGCSATVTREDNEDMKIFGALGPIIYTKTRKELIAEGWVANAKVYYLKPRFQSDGKFMDYQTVYSREIINNVDRNKLAVDTAIKEYQNGRKILILVTQIEHGQILYEMFNKQYGEYTVPKVIFVTGQSKTVDRAQDMSQYDIIIATQIYDEGRDLPHFDTIILACGGKSAVKLVQRVGRILRPKKDGRASIIYDFSDMPKYLKQQAIKRRKLLGEDFEVEDVERGFDEYDKA